MNREDFKRIKPWLIATDVAMLAYWSVTAAKALGLIDVPGEWLFSDYTNPAIVAWNWSFLPLDLLFSVSGITAAVLHAQQRPGWRPLAMLSLVFTWCAGFMAISFWAIRGDFDLLWWGANLFLLLWPMAFVPMIWRSILAEHAQKSPQPSTS